jgi:hypothetical protein
MRSPDSGIMHAQLLLAQDRIAAAMARVQAAIEDYCQRDPASPLDEARAIRARIALDRLAEAQRTLNPVVGNTAEEATS